MYANKLAIAIKHKGSVLREFNKDEVYLPFGADYSIFIKNLNSVRAQVKVSIDGKDVTEGVSLIVGAHNYIDLERFIKNGNLGTGNKFKFIERNAAVEAHRGVQVEDGLVRVEWQFERIPPKTYTWYHDPAQFLLQGRDHPYLNGNQITGGSYSASSSLRGLSGNVEEVEEVATASPYQIQPQATMNTAGITTPVATASPYKSRSINLNQIQPQAVVNTAGITAPGAISKQKFTSVSGFLLEDETHVMIFKLLGGVGPKKVKEAVTVKTVRECVACGSRKNSPTAKFCNSCGAGLQIV